MAAWTVGGVLSVAGLWCDFGDFVMEQFRELVVVVYEPVSV